MGQKWVTNEQNLHFVLCVLLLPLCLCGKNERLRLVELGCRRGESWLNAGAFGQINILRYDDE
jgi:hypothetical protein